jgi:hypothetical protein
MKKPNQMVQVDILEPFYLEIRAQNNFILSAVKMIVQAMYQVNGLKEKEV